MIPLYRPGSSALHRTPASAKLLLLLGIGIAASLWRDEVWVAVAIWGVVLLGSLFARPGWRGLGDLGAMLWRLKWLVALVAVPQLLFLTAEEAALNTARIIAVILLAGLFTLTTRVSDVQELIMGGFIPLERAGLGRLGVTAERVSLAMALTMRSVPVVFGFYGDIREARRARGAWSRLTGVAGVTTPLLVMSLRHAEETSEALAARGVR